MIAKNTLQKIAPYVIASGIFIAMTLAYFAPFLKGYQMVQGDIQQFIGQMKQSKDFRSETGKETYWVDNVFCGMPNYQIGAKYPYVFLNKIDYYVCLHFLFKYPSGFLWL